MFSSFIFGSFVPYSLVFILQAWTWSVRKDSTFIIFNCGNFERIGFRHRASQTLFLSELIDVSNFKDPGYGRLHIGLYMSILHDAMERTSHREQQENDNQERTRSKKRRRNQSSSGTQARRPKTRAYAAKERADEIKHQQTYEVGYRSSSMLCAYTFYLACFQRSLHS
jgi:hypothetical protein